jgi:hypothetical protein
MPSKSPAQARLFAAVAHNPAFAKKVGIPQSVGKDFNQADAGIIKPKQKPKHNRSAAVIKRGYHKMGKL